MWDGSRRPGREASAAGAEPPPPDRRYVQSGWMMRIKVFFFHNLGHFQAHFPDCCCGGWHRLPRPSTEHLNFPSVALSVRVLSHRHMAAEKLHYMVQIKPWGMRLFLTSIANPSRPLHPPEHTAPLHLFHILRRMWLTRVCFNYTVSVIYWEINLVSVGFGTVKL